MITERIFEAIDALLSRVPLEAMGPYTVYARLPPEEFEQLKEELLLNVVGSVLVKGGVQDFVLKRLGLDVHCVPEEHLLKPYLHFEEKK